jgi:chemotaxis protein methyltransferase CheR
LSSEDVSPEEFRLLRDYVQRECGIALADGKAYLLRTRLAPLFPKLGVATLRELHDRAIAEGKGAIREQIIDAMTTNETLWFRDEGPWQILRQELLPKFCDQLKSGAAMGRKIRIWSAASSTGQEPYSIAMLVLDHLREAKPPGVRAGQFQIVATDICREALRTATAARYDQLAAARGLDAAMRARYFESDGDAIFVKREVRELVRFQYLNLADPIGALGLFDLILCRNVLIYFSNQFKAQVVTKLRGALNEGGALIVGASESLQGALAHFELARCGTHLFYRAKGKKAA